MMITGNIITLGNGKTVKIQSLDARRLLINISTVEYIKFKTDENNHLINSISIEDKFNIHIGDAITLTNNNTDYVYQIEYIAIHEKDQVIMLYSTIPTKTAVFLFPILGGNLKRFKYDSYFVNAYLDNTHKFICLKYRFVNSEGYKQFEKEIMTDPSCVNHMEHGTDHVVFFFKIPPSFEKDVQYFIEGKYSKLSSSLKKCITDFYVKEDSEYVLDITNRSKTLRQSIEKRLDVELPSDAELASIPELETEIYKPYERKKQSRKTRITEG